MSTSSPAFPIESCAAHSPNKTEAGAQEFGHALTDMRSQAYERTGCPQGVNTASIVHLLSWFVLMFSGIAICRSDLHPRFGFALSAIRTQKAEFQILDFHDQKRGT
jgi:hypothetical protein